MKKRSKPWLTPKSFRYAGIRMAISECGDISPVAAEAQSLYLTPDDIPQHPINKEADFLNATLARKSS